MRLKFRLLKAPVLNTSTYPTHYWSAASPSEELFHSWFCWDNHRWVPRAESVPPANKTPIFLTRLTRRFWTHFEIFKFNWQRSFGSYWQPRLHRVVFCNQFSCCVKFHRQLPLFGDWSVIVVATRSRSCQQKSFASIFTLWHLVAIRSCPVHKCYLLLHL